MTGKQEAYFDKLRFTAGITIAEIARGCNCTATTVNGALGRIENQFISDFKRNEIFEFIEKRAEQVREALNRLSGGVLA